jgi:hypothetical protein
MPSGKRKLDGGNPCPEGTLFDAGTAWGARGFSLRALQAWSVFVRPAEFVNKDGGLGRYSDAGSALIRTVRRFWKVRPPGYYGQCPTLRRCMPIRFGLSRNNWRRRMFRNSSGLRQRCLSRWTRPSRRKDRSKRLTELKPHIRADEASNAFVRLNEIRRAAVACGFVAAMSSIGAGS